MKANGVMWSGGGSGSVQFKAGSQSGFSNLCRITVLTLMLSALPATAQLQVTCTVLDFELKGRYSGSCRDGLAEGYGEAVGSARYKGEFKAGRKHGKGVKTWPSGDRYEGEFVEDRKEGTGTYLWGTRSAWAGEKYAGGFMNDRRNGNGRYEWPNGDRYTGPWKEDMIVGKASPKMIARARTYAERMAAIGRVGVTVCREIAVGIARSDRIRGNVVEFTGVTLGVRIEDAGKFAHSLNDVEIARGIVLYDTPTAWEPCY